MTRVLCCRIVDSDCGRVSVILGTNGSGKTNLLRHIASPRSSQGSTNYLYVEGVRLVTDNLISFGVDRNNFDQYGNAQKDETNFASTRRGGLSNRVLYSLLMLKIRSEQQEKEYLRQLRDWDKFGRVRPSPEGPVYIKDQVFSLFSKIFPSIEIFVTENEQLYCKQHGRMYPMSQASEGERQVFALLADLLLHPLDDLLVLVDEPEAHLNPLLACDVWDARPLSTTCVMRR